MKKRILALALAATTAFSMLGSGLSVSAIDAWKDNDNYMFPARLNFNYTPAKGEEDAYVVVKLGEGKNEKEIDLSDIAMVTSVEDALAYEVDTNTVFVYDYFNDDKATWGKLEEVYDNGDVIELGKMLTGKTELTEGDNYAEFKLRGSVHSLRTQIVDAFNTFYKSVVTEEDVTEDDLNFKGLLKNLATVASKPQTYTSSALIAYMQAYNTYVEYAGLPDVGASIEKVQAKLDALYARGEEEFKYAKDYKYFIADLDDAQASLDKAETLGAVRLVDKGLDTISVKYDSAGANKNELKDLLLSLFDGATISEIRSMTKYGGSKAIYDAKDYDTKATDDAWDVFNETFVKAVGMYKRVNSDSFQTDVNNMVAELQAAVDGLSSTSTIPNWKMVQLEETLAKVYALEEGDYSKAGWKTISSAIAKAEAIVDAEKPGATAVDRAISALEDALKLKPVKPSYTEEKALKNAVATAEKTLKGLDKASNGAQYYALTAAIDEAKALFKEKDTSKGLNDGVRKSQVAKAIDALNAAIDFSEVVIGWNQLANGTWMYGTEDGYVTSAWKWIGSAWYYFDANGIMVTGWQQLDGAWYYFYNWGGMAKGWALVNGTWYYLNPNGGKMLANGWNWIDGKCYYFYSWGGMAANTTIDGYKVDASGAWVK